MLDLSTWKHSSLVELSMGLQFAQNLLWISYSILWDLKSSSRPSRNFFFFDRLIKTLLKKTRRESNSLVHRMCTRKAKVYPKLHKSTKSKTEACQDHSKQSFIQTRNKENVLQLDDRSLLPFEDSVIQFSPYVPHNKMRNNILSRCWPMSPNTSRPTS